MLDSLLLVTGCEIVFQWFLIASLAFASQLPSIAWLGFVLKLLLMVFLLLETDLAAVLHLLLVGVLLLLEGFQLS